MLLIIWMILFIGTSAVAVDRANEWRDGETVFFVWLSAQMVICMAMAMIPLIKGG